MHKKHFTVSERMALRAFIQLMVENVKPFCIEDLFRFGDAQTFNEMKSSKTQYGKWWKADIKSSEHRTAKRDIIFEKTMYGLHSSPYVIKVKLTGEEKKLNTDSVSFSGWQISSVIVARVDIGLPWYIREYTWVDKGNGKYLHLVKELSVESGFTNIFSEF